MKKVYISSILATLLLGGCGSDDTTGNEEVEVEVESNPEVTYTSAKIILEDENTEISGSGVTLSGNRLTLSMAGDYNISGSLSDGEIIVEAPENGDVRLYLNGVDIHSEETAPITILSAKNTTLNLSGENYFSDANIEREEDSVIYSKDDLTISGNGSLIVTSNYNDGIKGKDGLVIESGNIEIASSVDDGIIGKDYIVIKNGNFSINATGDGLKSTNDEDAERGYIEISGGDFSITAGNDGIQSEQNMTITGGTFAIETGGGSSATSSDSAKGLKSNGSIHIIDGNFVINSADDTINADVDVLIDGGNISLSSADDGIRADFSLEINSGEINISKSYEGLESRLGIINGGEIHIVASDDGINMVNTDTETATVTTMAMGAFGFDENRTKPTFDENRTMPDRGAIGGMMEESGEYYLYINGGTIYVNAEGDGLDSNGYIEMNGGTVFVTGPTANNNGALDVDYTFNINGGNLLAVGSSGMAESPSETSTQNSVLLNLSSIQSAGTEIGIENSFGTNLIQFAPNKEYQSIVFSSEELVEGNYSLILDGTIFTDFTVSGIVTEIK
jgi:hypothetical protein